MGKRKKEDPRSETDSDSNLDVDLDSPPTDSATQANDSRMPSDSASVYTPRPTPAKIRTDPRMKHGLEPEPYLDPLGSFILVKPVDPDVSFRKVNVWAPPKQIEAICGPNIKLNTKALRDGSLLIKTNSSRQTRLLLKQKTFCLKNVTVSLHQTLNQAKGTIFAPELKFMSEEELMEGMSGENVSHVRRITTYRDGQRRDTSLLVLTFNYAVLPLKITCGYLSYEVRPFVPNPLRCFSCQKFGHGKNTCKQSPLCADCAQPAHEGSCQSPKP